MAGASLGAIAPAGVSAGILGNSNGNLKRFQGSGFTGYD